MSRVLVSRELLLRLEWSGKTRNTGRPKCVVCLVVRKREDSPHAPGCELAAAIQAEPHECACVTCAVRAGAYVVKEKPSCFRCLGTGRWESAGFSTTCPTCEGTGEKP